MKKTFGKVVAAMGILGLIASLLGCSDKVEIETKGESSGTEAAVDGYDSGLRGSDGAGDSAAVNTSGVTCFYYSYAGSVGGDSYSYRAEKGEEGVVFTYETQTYGEMSCGVPEDMLKQLNDIYLDMNLARWDGFDKSNTDVLDGDGFYMSCSFEDGGEMSASGSNAYPEGYSEFCDRIDGIFESYVDELMQQAGQGKIDEGVQGSLNFIMANFKQQGASGDDEYNFYITDSESHENNFNVTIKSRSGEFIEEGSYRYYCSLPDEAVNFETIQELIEKYDVIQWYGWDKTADNYDDCEWFQIDFGFDDGSIDACGTEHPENYDEFRSEFLKTMIGMIKNAEENYGLKQYE